MANSNLPQGFRPKGKPLRQNTYIASGTIYAGDLCLAPAAGVVAACAGGETAVSILGAAVNSATNGQPVEVADHPSQLYSVQASSAASTDVGKYCSPAAGSGSAAFNVSRQTVSGLSTTATLPLQIQGIDGDIKNSTGSNAKVIVRINTYGA